MPMSDEEILRALAEIVEEVAGVPAADVRPEKSFVADLEVDSLSMIEIGLAVEDKLGIDVPDEALKDLKTVGDVVALVQRSTVPA